MPISIHSPTTIMNQNSPYDRILLVIERYGLFLVLGSAFTLLSPDLSPKGYLMDRDLDAVADTSTGSSKFKQILWLGLFAFYSLSMVRESTRVNILKEKWALIIIVILCVSSLLLTTIWSDFRSLTIKRSVFQIILTVDVFCAVYFSVKHETFDKNVRMIALFMVAITILGIGLGTAFRGIELVSWATTKNVFGSIMLANAFIYFCIEKRLIDKLLMPILTIFLILSISKTSIALFFFIYLLNSLNIAFSKYLFIVISYLVLVPFLVAPMIFSSFGMVYFPAMNADPEFMTGRGLIWQLLYNDILTSSHMLTGHGYGAYFNTGVPPDPFNVKDSFLMFLNQSHNSYLDLALQIGFPLTSIIMFTIVSIVRRVNIRQVYIAGIVLLFYGVNEGAILRDQNHVWTGFLVVLSWSLIKSKRNIYGDNT